MGTSSGPARTRSLAGHRELPAHERGHEVPALWLATRPDGSVTVELSFAYVALEFDIGGDDDDEAAAPSCDGRPQQQHPHPKKRRVWCKNPWGTQEPTVADPWVWTRCKPVRHEWVWEDAAALTRPTCATRRDLWDSDEYRKLEENIDGPDVEEAGRGGLRSLLKGHHHDHHHAGALVAALGPASMAARQREAQLELGLARVDWRDLYPLMPFKDVKNLRVLLERISSDDALGSIELVMGGNLAWHAARKGDTLLCNELIVAGHGALARERAFDGKTAYEIALCSGYPDTVRVCAGLRLPICFSTCNDDDDAGLASRAVRPDSVGRAEDEDR